VQASLRSGLNLGFLIGGTVMMAMQMLMLAVLSSGNLARFGGGSRGASPAAEKAVSGFSVLLLFAYVSSFCCFVASPTISRSLTFHRDKPRHFHLYLFALLDCGQC
jgi:hypothetical protein